MGKSNKVVDALSHCLIVPEEVDSDCKSEEYETISYVIIFEDINDIPKGEEIPIECKQQIQVRSKEEPKQNDLELHSNMIQVLGKMTPPM